MNKCLQSLAVRGGTGYLNEPRYDGYVPPAGDDAGDEDYHLKGPDVRLHLAHTLVLDLKGINGSCQSYVGTKPVTTERRKEAASRKLYESHCNALGERFLVPCFHVCGRLDPTFVAVVKELVAQRPETLRVKRELMKCAVALQRGVGRVMLGIAGSRGFRAAELGGAAAATSE